MLKKLFLLLLIVHVTIVRSKERENVKEDDDGTINVDGPDKKLEVADVVSSNDEYSGSNHAPNSDDETDEDDEDEDKDDGFYNDDKGSSEDQDRFEYSGYNEKPCVKANKSRKKSSKNSEFTFECDKDGYFKEHQKDDMGLEFCLDKMGEKKHCEANVPLSETATKKANVAISVLNTSSSKDTKPPSSALRSSFLGHPGLLAAIIGGAVVGLLCAVLLVMFLVYRMKKKDEGSYALDEPSKRGRSPAHMGYQKAPSKEYYA